MSPAHGSYTFCIDCCPIFLWEMIFDLDSCYGVIKSKLLWLYSIHQLELWSGFIDAFSPTVQSNTASQNSADIFGVAIHRSKRTWAAITIQVVLLCSTPRHVSVPWTRSLKSPRFLLLNELSISHRPTVVGNIEICVWNDRPPVLVFVKRKYFLQVKGAALGTAVKQTPGNINTTKVSFTGLCRAIQHTFRCCILTNKIWSDDVVSGGNYTRKTY